MPTQLTVDYDAVNRRIARHEQTTLRSLAPFALAVIGATLMWLAFVEYL